MRSPRGLPDMAIGVLRGRHDRLPGHRRGFGARRFCPRERYFASSTMGAPPRKSLWPLTGTPRPALVPASPEEIRRALETARTRPAGVGVPPAGGALRGAGAEREGHARRSPDRARPRQGGDGQARGGGTSSPRPSARSTPSRRGEASSPRLAARDVRLNPISFPNKRARTVHGPPGRHRRHRSVELPGRRALSLGLPGAAHGQRRHPQAVGAHAAREHVVRSTTSRASCPSAWPRSVAGDGDVGRRAHRRAASTPACSPARRDRARASASAAPSSASSPASRWAARTRRSSWRTAISRARWRA